MKIAVGTTNGAKRKAVETVIAGHWPDAELFFFNAPSGVSEQPFSDEETILGAINRAKASLTEFSEADFGIGLEGGVSDTTYGMFLKGWVAVVSREGTIGIGGSPQIELPTTLSEPLRKGEELGPLQQKLGHDPDGTKRHSGGTFELLTKGRYTRIMQFTDALEMALTPHINKEFYQ